MKAAHWFALIPLVLICSASCADVTLLAPGAPAPVVVTIGEADVVAGPAAELAKYIGAMTGAEPAIVAEADAAADAPRIVLGLAEGMTPESFTLKATGNSVVVTSADGPGLWFGMYTVLEELGCRFYFPGDLGENVPVTDTLTLPEMDRVESPAHTPRDGPCGVAGLHPPQRLVGVRLTARLAEGPLRRLAAQDEDGRREGEHGAQPLRHLPAC